MAGDRFQGEGKVHSRLEPLVDALFQAVANDAFQGQRDLDAYGSEFRRVVVEDGAKSIDG